MEMHNVLNITKCGRLQMRIIVLTLIHSGYKNGVICMLAANKFILLRFSLLLGFNVFIKMYKHQVSCSYFTTDVYVNYLRQSQICFAKPVPF